MSIRLAYLVSQYPTITHTFILREIRALRTQGFDITVVSVRPADRPLAQLSPEECDEAQRTWFVLSQGWLALIPTQLAVFLSRPGAYLSGLTLALTLARWDGRAVLHNLGYFVEAMTAGRYMEAQGLQHFHTHFSSTVALLLSKVFPLTFSATIHGPEEFDNAKGFYLAEKVAAGRFFCTISQYSRSQLMRASQPEHWDKLEVAPLGVDPESFTPRPHRAQPNRFEILSVGRLAPAKAHAILLRAIAILVRQGHANLRLRIAGGGPDYALLSQQIVNLGLQEHAFLLGPCPQDQVRQLYRETDLFALASFAEGVPVVLMEAMAMEIPCLSTWVMGIPELIQHGESGWLVPPSEPQLLAEGIAHLMSDPELRQRLGQQGRVQVQKNYNLTANTALLREILTRRLSRESAVPPLKE